ncbi:PPE family protein [Mycobacterium bohemicum DSM 44277]|uniref:PPE family protein n=1 Tax=Mycobacterium bohemicum DSM 44277 TaxID=1236609 RepID=A0A0U0W771_MYCBE|nr:PPE family protein [Mycobacterium bohemicum DSM 44277]
MLDYGALPPEINSARMYAGAGSGPMMAAAAAWDVLANALESVGRAYATTIARLQGEGWSGAAAQTMAGAVAPYVAWVSNAGAQAEEAASQARAAAAAYETALAATVPPALVTANRTELATLMSTNVFGQNTGMIAATEAQYEQMWAQDAAAMYRYAASSSAATTLRQFTQPPQTTNAAAQPAQAAAVAQATGSSAAGNAQTTLSQLMASVPQQLQALATTGASSSGLSATAASSPLSQLEALIPSPLLTAFSNFNTFTSPVNLGDGISRTLTSAGSFGTGVQRVGLQEAGAAAKAAGAAAHGDHPRAGARQCRQRGLVGEAIGPAQLDGDQPGGGRPRRRSALAFGRGHRRWPVMGRGAGEQHVERRAGRRHRRQVGPVLGVFGQQRAAGGTPQIHHAPSFCGRIAADARHRTNNPAPTFRVTGGLRRERRCLTSGHYRPRSTRPECIPVPARDR